MKLRKKIFYSFIFGILLCLIFTTTVMSASANITANTSSVNVGDKVTITVNATMGACNLVVSGNRNIW